jgi:hypothetical protein
VNLEWKRQLSIRTGEEIVQKDHGANGVRRGPRSHGASGLITKIPSTVVSRRAVSSEAGTGSHTPLQTNPRMGRRPAAHFRSVSRTTTRQELQFILLNLLGIGSLAAPPYRVRSG